jgi:hypothetical protein
VRRRYDDVVSCFKNFLTFVPNAWWQNCWLSLASAANFFMYKTHLNTNTMNIFDFLDKVLSTQYPMATVWMILFSIIITVIVFFWFFRKPLFKYIFHDKLRVATKNELSNGFDKVDKEIISLRTDVKNDVVNLETKLKENDFFHTNKAILILASGLLQDKTERFERIKDTILESTPENRRDEIKTITL